MPQEMEISVRYSLNVCLLNVSFFLKNVLDYHRYAKAQLADRVIVTDQKSILQTGDCKRRERLLIFYSLPRAEILSRIILIYNYNQIRMIVNEI